MKKTITRALVLLLVGCMLFGIAGCGQKEEPIPTENGSQSKYAPEDIVTVRILAQEYGDPSYARRWDQKGMQLVRKVAYEEFGLILQLEETVGGDDNFKSILNTKLAADKGVPDVVRFDLDISALNQLYNSGKILNLSDYAEYMPDVVSTFEEIPSLKQGNCTATGDILRIPKVAYNIQHMTNWGSIRQDWLDALGLKMPTTTEEFREVLRAFQKNDMNGNGMPDEVFVAGYEVMNIILAPAFGVRGMTEATDSWYVDSNGKVYCSMLTKEAKAYVEYVASMFKEGLFWVDGFSNMGQELVLVNENRRAGKFGAYWDSLLNNIDAKGYGRPDEYTPMLPLSDGTHPANIMIQNYTGHTSVFLTKNCPAPERVVAFYNWCYDKDATTLLYLGDDPKNPVYYKEVPLSTKITAEQAAMLELSDDETTMELTEEGEALAARERSITGYLGGNNDLWPGKAINTPEEIAIDFYTSYDREATRCAGDLEMNYKNLTWPYQEGNSFNNLNLAVMTDAQYQVILEHADLFVYINEMYRKFMTGVEPISKWDDFVSECYRQGMNEVLDVVQQRYDALN